jgi:hypothetical protein
MVRGRRRSGFSVDFSVLQYGCDRVARTVSHTQNTASHKSHRALDRARDCERKKIDKRLNLTITKHMHIIQHSGCGSDVVDLTTSPAQSWRPGCGSDF